MDAWQLKPQALRDPVLIDVLMTAPPLRRPPLNSSRILCKIHCCTAVVEPRLTQNTLFHHAQP
uniref:Uncharacterized protein n=1 Tax=mine drainage metagenome TaxID=410659 RepID=E6PLI0_9ZZZZ